MKLLLDTNIFIPLEPAGRSDIVPNTELANGLLRLAQEGHHAVFRHPLSNVDIGRDRDTSRASLLGLRLDKYPVLPDPPAIGSALVALLGDAEPGGNDWVDNHLIAALRADAIDLLVSEDKGLRAKARRIGLGARVLTLAEALHALGRPSLPAPPAVKAVKAHDLSPEDPVFESFRLDYQGFDAWFSKCRREHRQAWRIDSHRDELAAFCIVKDETDKGFHLGPHVLKICCFKVAPAFNGFKYGELLLKTIFDYAHLHNHTGLYVTVFAKQAQLVELFEDFGFAQLSVTTDLGELILTKSLQPALGNQVRGLAYHLQFGPPRFDAERDWHVVPILPEYSDVLFPETSLRPSLFEGHNSFGNAIRKAYLCNSPSRRVSQGDVLAFYRTHEQQGVIAIGIVEDTMVSADPGLISRAVARRTVYSTGDIENLCRRHVLALLFRQARLVRPRRRPAELVAGGVFLRAPQSIMKVERRGTQWLRAHLGQ